MAQAVGRATCRRPGRPVVAVLAGLGVAAVVVAFFGVSAGGPHAGLGLPDSGSLVTYGVPVLRVLTETAAACTVGLLLLTAFLLPPAGAVVSTTGRRVLRWAAGVAALWAAGALVTVPFAVADLFGRELPDVLTVRHLLDIAPQLPFLAAWYVSAVLAGIVAVIAGRARSWGGTVAAFVLASAAVLPVAATGHSATGTTQDVATDSLVVHVLAVMLWIGGVIALLALPALKVSVTDATRAAARFSGLALVCWLVTAGSGVTNLIARVAPTAWFTSAYGLLAMAKIAALLLLGVIGYAHRRHTLRLLKSGNPRGLVRLAAAEVVVMVGTVGLAVALGRTAPPAGPDERPTRIAYDIGYDLAGPPTTARLLLDWRLDLLWTALALLAAGAYWVVRRRLLARGTAWPATRTVAWLGGCAAIVLATSSGIGRYAPAVFSVLVLQQVLLAVVAPLLLVLGAPVTALVRLGERSTSIVGSLRRLALTTARSRSFRWATDPAVALPVYLLTSIVVVMSGAFGGVLELHWGRHLLEVQFLLGGLLLFAALLGRRAGRVRMSASARWLLFLVIIIAHQAAGLWLAITSDLIGADWFAGLSLPWGPDPLTDQRYRASVAWWSGEIPLLAVLGVAFLDLWGGPSHRHPVFAETRLREMAPTQRPLSPGSGCSTP